MSTEIEDEVEFRERVEKKLEDLDTQADRHQIFPTQNEDLSTSTGDSKALGSGSTLSVGTVENEHLEWNNSTSAWEAVQAMTHGATGPFAATGFHRFANDQIMLSARNAGDSGNVELKINASNFFDFTRDDNGATTIQIRTQHATLGDNNLTISQTSGGGSSAIFNAPGEWQFETGATTLLVFDEPNAGEGRIKFAGTPAFDRFQVAFETDTYFTGSGTPGRLNVVSSGVNVFTFQSNGASFLGTSTNLFFNGGYIQMLERASKPTAVANTAQMYSKDVSTVTKMFIQFSNGSEIEIGSGGFPVDDTVFKVQDNADNTKTFSMELSGASTGVDSVFLFTGVTADRFYTLPNISGKFAMLNGGLQLFAADIELQGLFSPDTDLGTSLGLAAKRFTQIFAPKWILGTTGTPIPNIELISDNIHIEASSGNDIVIEENGTLFVRFDGGDNRAKFTRDMTLSSTRRLRAEVDSTEIGICVDGFTGTLGTEGTMTGPYFEDTTYPDNAATEIDFNGNDGSIGVQHDTDAGGSADARFVFRAGGVWYFLTGFKV